MFELYHSAFSTCSQKVRLCLAEKGLGYESRPIAFTARQHLTPEYLKLNPNGVVPTLVHDGAPVIESSVICEYLDEIAPEPPLSPADALGRARMRAWMRYLEEVPTASIRVPSFNTLFAEQNGKLTQDEMAAVAEQLPLRKHFYLKMHKGRFSDTEYDASLERLSQTIDRAEAALARTAWLAADQFTIADILLVPTVVRMDDIGLAHLWAERPAFTDWYARIQARPSFQVAYFEGSRITPDQFSFAKAEPEGV